MNFSLNAHETKIKVIAHTHEHAIQIISKHVMPNK